MSKSTKSKSKPSSEKDYVNNEKVEQDTETTPRSKRQKSVTVSSLPDNTQETVVSKKDTSKRSKKPKNVEEPVEEHVEETVDEHTEEHVEQTEESGESLRRREVTKESLLSSLDEVMNMIEEEVTKMRESSSRGNPKNVKFLRTLKKRLSTIKSDTSKVVKQKSQTKRKTNGNSGFLKPVKISSEMAKFTKWGSDDMKSRVDVTKYICNYIKEHNLQNPSDKRQILADDSLCKILGYDPKKDGTLTYPKMQGFLKRHFTKV